MTHEGGTPAEIVVIGGGCSGSLITTALLEAADRVSITMFEQRALLGRGLAYSTSARAHLLNVRASALSARVEDPDHFLEWAQRRDPAIVKSDFLPRSWYGEYLEEELRAAAAASTSSFRSVQGRVVSIRRRAERLEVQYEAGRVLADHVVLALGHVGQNNPIRHVRWPVGHPQYIDNPWTTNVLRELDDSVPTLLLGTGLTMVDTALAIRARRSSAALIAVSRHGLLPRRHASAAPAPTPRPPEPPSPTSAADLLRWVRPYVVAAGDDWAVAIDALRPITNELWRSLSPADQARFLRHAHRYWEVHRHRLPPSVGDEIEHLVADGSLSIVAGRLTNARSIERRRVQVEIRRRSGDVERLTVGAVINCTGPTTSLDRSNDALVVGLLGRGMARCGPHGLGLDVDDSGSVADAIGRPQRRLSALGPLCRGARWETTAVPEIRAQAFALAQRLAGEFAPARTESCTRTTSSPVAVCS